MLGNKLPNIQFAKYHIWNNNSEGFPNMVLSTETLNQSVRTEYSEAVNARYTFQPLWVSDSICVGFRNNLFAFVTGSHEKHFGEVLRTALESLNIKTSNIGFSF